MPLKIASVEDDRKYGQTIREFIARYMTGKDLSYSLDAFSDAESFLSSELFSYDLVFLDIRLPGLDGLSAAHQFREKNTRALIIFLTNMSHLAVKGYSVNALDFIIKPLIYHDFVVTMDRAMNVLRMQEKSDFLCIRSGTKIFRFNPAELKYVEVLGHNMVFHLEREQVEIRCALAAVEADLEKAGLIKANRSFMVNPDFIDAVTGNDIRIGGDTVTLSQSQKKAFLARFNAWLDEGGR